MNIKIKLNFFNIDKSKFNLEARSQICVCLITFAVMISVISSN